MLADVSRQRMFIEILEESISEKDKKMSLASIGILNSIKGRILIYLEGAKTKAELRGFEEDAKLFSEFMDKIKDVIDLGNKCANDIKKDNFESEYCKTYLEKIRELTREEIGISLKAVTIL